MLSGALIGVAGGGQVGLRVDFDFLDAAQVGPIVCNSAGGLGLVEHSFLGGVVAVYQVKFGGFVELVSDDGLNDGAAGRLAPDFYAGVVVTFSLVAFFVGLGLGRDRVVVIEGSVTQVLHNLGSIV